MRGNYTHYDRDQNALWKVTAVKVSAPVDEEEPDWDEVDPIRQYEYYGQGSQYGLPGQLWKDIVPDIDGSVDQITEYRYAESGKKRLSPTETIYQYWNGSAYESKTSSASYSDMQRLLSTTDAEDRTITYQYDQLGRQTKVIYAEGVETENSYGCCTPMQRLHLRQAGQCGAQAG